MEQRMQKLRWLCRMFLLFTSVGVVAQTTITHDLGAGASPL